MAAGEWSGGSDLRFAQRRNPLLLLLLPLLLPARPALGNEGGAAGSCQCEKYSTEPELVRRFSDRLVAWERCRGLIRFIFPKNLVCGLDDAPWVLRLISRKGEKRKGSARVNSSERSCQPSCTSHAPLQPLSSVGSTPVVPMETLSQQVPRETPPSQWLLALTHTTAAPALESVWRVVLSRNAGAVAEVSPTQFGQEEGVSRWHQTAVLSALGIVLFFVVIGLLCWWRPPRRGCQAALTSEQQVGFLPRFIFSAALVPLRIWDARNRRTMALLSRTSGARWRRWCKRRGLCCSHYLEMRGSPPPTSFVRHGMPNSGSRKGIVAKQNRGCSAHFLWAPFFWAPSQPSLPHRLPLELAWGLSPTREAALPLRRMAGPWGSGGRARTPAAKGTQTQRAGQNFKGERADVPAVGKPLEGGELSPTGTCIPLCSHLAMCPPPAQQSLMLHSGANSNSPFQVWMLQRPGGAPTWRPRADAAAGSGYGG